MLCQDVVRPAAIVPATLPMSSYSLDWTCASCKTQNERPLTKIEAAFFDSLNIRRTLRCRKCGGSTIGSWSHPTPDPADPEVMDVWMGNKKLFFLEQDEELFLGGIDARRLIELLSDPKTPRWRSGTLFLALVYKVYGGKYVNAAEEKAARSYLNQHLAVWKDSKAMPFQIRKAVLQALQEN